jgi:tetratricopeptide (TPR) repeat protein
MNFKKIASTCYLCSLFTMLASPTWADMQSEIQQLQQRWAQVNYQLAGKTQLTAFETLMEDAENLAKKHPDAAPVWIWNGIIKSTYAGAKGGLSALKFAKASKADLEHALEIEPQAMNGSAYTSLGTLYFNVPGWPIGFGDDDKAEELLLKALAINPTGIDSNYFYGEYLLSEKRYKEAQTFLLKAQSAPKRQNRPLADTGRQKEISEALVTVRKKL